MPKILHSLLPKSLHFWLLFTIFAFVRFAVLAQTARIPVPVFSQVFRPSSNGRHILPLPSLKAVFVNNLIS